MNNVVDIVPYLKGEEERPIISIENIKGIEKAISVDDIQFVIRLIEVVDSRDAFRYDEAEIVKAVYYRLREFVAASTVSVDK